MLDQGYNKNVPKVQAEYEVLDKGLILYSSSGTLLKHILVK